MGLRRGELRRSSVVGRLTMGPTPAGANTHTILTIVDDGGSAMAPLTACLLALAAVAVCAWEAARLRRSREDVDPSRRPAQLPPG